MGQKHSELNVQIKNRSDNKSLLDNDFDLKINSFINKITSSIESFNLNVVVANVYEIYNLFSINLSKELTNECLNRNIV